MSTDYGSGVSRTLTAIDRQYGPVVWQKGKPPLDSELNLMSQIDWERFRLLVKGMMPSGFLLDPTRAIEEFEFNPQWANLFSLGNPKESFGTHETGELDPIIWANVNGWVLPVAGSNITVDGDVRNFVKLYPAPESDTRVDFVFLEAWQTLVAPNPSTTNKPNASTVWKYGNVKHGGTNLVDDIEDPAIGFETSERVQVQYRLRVFGSGVGQGAGLALDVYPDGLDDPNVLGQGAAGAPVAGVQFTNMREELADPSLWRAGDGDPNNDLGTVDGYVYAIPVCAIFRRNSNVYTGISSSGNPNQNGAFERTPASKFLANPLEGSRILLTPTLTSALTATDGVSADFVLDVTNLNGSGLGDASLTLTSTFLKIGDEIIGVSAVDATNNRLTIPAGGRGRYGSAVVGHDEGSTVEFFNSRPDGAFADEVRATDVLDLRRGVNPGDWDYIRILEHNVSALARGDLRTAWKQSAPGDTEGPVIHEVDYLRADGSTNVPNHTEALDGPDGVRYVWSDGASIQPDVSMLLHNEAPKDANGVGLTGADGFDTLTRWETDPGFNPVGFMNVGSAPTNGDSFANGSSIFLFIGGNNGSLGARGTFRNGAERAVRFVTPREFWKTGYPNVDPNSGNQYPITLRFLDERSHEPIPPTLVDQSPADDSYLTRHPGPMYPWRNSNFERPFIVLGGLLNSALRVSGLTTANLNNVVAGTQLEIDVGIDFDALGSYYSLDANGNFETDPTAITGPVLRGERTLFDMMTAFGKDRTGAASEVYVVLYGDDDNAQNNGAFKVIGAGTVGYTDKTATNTTSIVVEPLSADFTAWNGATGGFIDSSGGGKTVTVEFRSQYHNVDDQSDYASRIGDLAIVLTDIGGAAEHPWSQANLGTGTAYDVNLPTDAGLGRVAVASKAVLSTTLMYNPGRSAMARVPDEVVRVGLRGGAAASNSGTYLQQNRTQIDTSFASFTGVPTDEAHFSPVHVQTWNRLPSKGWHAPLAPNYGGDVVGFTEIGRENQAFFDKGSKTLIFRPFRDREMTMRPRSWDANLESPIDLTESLIGDYIWADLSPKDPLNLWTGGAAAGKKMGIPVPREFMPRFGRQDIPYYQDTLAGAGLFLSGINHLFLDKADDTEPVFEIIGGEDNVSAGNEVTPLHFITNEPGTDYGHAGTVPAVANQPFIGARKVPLDIAASVAAATARIRNDLAAVNSSDFGRGLTGIQFPPHYGPARIYGVYERADWEAQGGDTFAADRITALANPATNLLREDAENQTLFILQDGGEDLTGELHDHTYLLPEQALDISRVPGFDPDVNTFASYEYVVECVAFGFARGFINQNNFVLQRRHNGQGTLRSDGDDRSVANGGAALEYEAVRMCIPAPAGLNDGLFVAHNRTVYQGDVFMSRNGETRTTSDYENRYGQLDMSGQSSLKTAIQQFDAAGDFVPETPNARAFQVLASLDFYTTLGTGKVGGDMFPGTPLDVGYTDNSPLAATRLPTDSSDPAWRILTRAFSEGQKANTSRASATLEILDNQSMENVAGEVDAFRIRIGLLDDTVVDLYSSPLGFDATLTGAGVPAENIFRVDQVGTRTDLIYRRNNMNFGTLAPTPGSLTATATFTPDPGAHTEAPLPTGADAPQFSVSVTPASDYANLQTAWGSVVFDGKVLANGDVEVRASYVSGPVPFNIQDSAAGRNVRKFTYDLANTLADATTTQAIAWVGADPTLDQAVLVTANPPLDGFAVVAYVDAADSVTLSVTNLTGGAIDPPSTEFIIAIVEDVVPTDFDIDLSAEGVICDISYERGSKDVTANNLVAAINAHSLLGSSVSAFNDGTSKVTIESVPVGTEGNQISLTLSRESFGAASAGLTVLPIEQVLKLAVPRNNKRVVQNTTSTRLRGGVDLPVNAGPGSTQLRLTGMTERLPLGALLQDSDFLGENPYGDTASAMRSSPATLRPIQNLLPMTNGGEEFTRFMGAPGELIGMSDGAVAIDGFLAYTKDTPSGSKRFRMYRGGGSVFMLSGKNPGGPVDWVSESFPSAQQPVLKGGILSCKALLVRNFYEEAFSGPYKVNDGDEIQMVLITHGIFGDWQTTKEGVTLFGIISPAGYGEGYSAADRYRCHGRPMSKGFTRQAPNPASVTLAVFDEQDRANKSAAAKVLTDDIRAEEA